MTVSVRPNKNRARDSASETQADIASEDGPPLGRGKPGRESAGDLRARGKRAIHIPFTFAEPIP